MAQLPPAGRHGGRHQYSGHPYPPYAPPAPPPARNGLGIAALVLGLVALPFLLTGLTAPVSIVLGLVAVPLALVGLGRVRRGQATNRGTAITGLILGLVGVGVGILAVVVTVQAVDEALNGPTGTVVGASGPADDEQPASSGPVPIGTAIDVDGLTVTVTGIEQRDSLGSKVTCAAVEYRNGSGGEVERNPFDWTARNADGASVRPTIYVGRDALEAGPLADGGATDGLVCFDVRRDDVAVVEYRATPFADGPTGEWDAARR